MRQTLMAVALASGLTTAAGAQTIAITGARIHPVSGPRIDNGTILIRDGKITAVGSNVAVPANARRIDATGRWVTPGIFNAATQLGISEVNMAASTNDYSARGRGDGITAWFRPWEGIDPHSVHIITTRNDGITTAGVIPSGGLVTGQAGVVDLLDGSMRDMVLRAPAAVFADLSSASASRGASRGEMYDRLRTLLQEARDYPRRRSAYEAPENQELVGRRSDMEALQPVLARTIPLVVNVDRSSDIEMMLEIAREFRVRLALASAAEAWRVADKIAAAQAIVLTDAFNNIPQTFSTLAARQENAALLQRAGVKVVIAEMTMGPPLVAGSFNARNIKYQAGIAVAFGLPWEAALRAITLAPAELYGVQGRVGSIEAGKDATVVIWSGDPFEPYTRAEHVFIRGQEVQRPSRQDELMQQYRRLPPSASRP